jgi:hypothetical protein
MSRHVDDILKRPGLLCRRWSKHVRLRDLHGVDPELFKMVPENASVIAMDAKRFSALPEEEKRALIEEGFGICNCSIWSTQALDEASVSDLAEEPAKQHSPLRVLPDYYVIVYQEKGETRFLPLRKVFHKQTRGH